MSDVPKLTAHRQAMRELDWQIRSKRALVYIVTHEERRVLDAIQAITERDDHRWNLVTWDIVNGLESKHESAIPSSEDECRLDQIGVLEWFSRQQMPKGEFLIVVLKDFHKFMGSDGNAGQVEHQVVRLLRNICQDSATKQRALVIISPSMYLPQELTKATAVIDWPIPEPQHILDKVDDSLKAAAKRSDVRSKFRTEYSQKELDDIVRAFQGLTIEEIETLCLYSVITSSELDPGAISKHKRDIIRKAGLLEWIEAEVGMDNVGGLHEVKRWLMKRRDAFSNDAKEYGLPANPQGILFVGVQGAGKSLFAKTISNFWNLPLLRLDMGKVFHGIVGSSEENMRSVIKLAESVAPCILWTDEIDKGFSGTASSNQSDGGTAARVFGSFLTWMNEKNAPVFVVATANDVSQLPPELLRKGRFDEIFFVDLPTERDRRDIFAIHIKKRGRNPEDYDIARLARISSSFTGAEIEAAIISAMYEAFDDDKRDFVTADVEKAIKETVPLAVTMREKINDLRSWASTRARNASKNIGEVGDVNGASLDQMKRDIMASLEDADREEDL